MNRLIFFTTFVLLSGCVSAPYQPSNAAIDRYLSNQVISNHISKFYNEEYGVINTNEEPLKTIYANCEKEAFEGFSITLGTHVITDIDTLMQIQVDHITQMLASIRRHQNNRSGSAAHAGAGAATAVMSGDTSNIGYNQPISKSIFDDTIVRDKVMKIVETNQQKLQCLTADNWITERERDVNNKRQ
jgi:hypothetical protein